MIETSTYTDVGVAGERGTTGESLQRAGGVAALVDVATFVVGFALFATLIAAAGYGSLADPGGSVAFLVENQTLMYAWNVVIYVVFGVALVVLTLAPYDRLKPDTPALAATAAAFGLIWSGLVLTGEMVANVGPGTVVDIYGLDRRRPRPSG